MKALKRAWRRLRQIRLWILVVGTFTAGVLIFHATLGLQYLQAQSREGQLTQDVARLGRIVRSAAARGADAEARLKNAQDTLARTRGVFQQEQGDGLVALLVESARLSNVTVRSVRVGEAKSQTVGGTTYQVQSIRLQLYSTLEELLGFLSTLGDKGPTAQVSGLEVTRDAEGLITGMNVLFYMLPPAAAEG